MSKRKNATAIATLLDPDRRSLVVGVAVMALFTAAVIFGLNATHGVPLVDRRVVKVAFEDLSGLNAGDDVRIASKRVGYVDSLELEHGRAVAVLKIDDPDTKLYENARAARVSDRSGLGQKFVDLDPGDPSTGPLRSGGTIPVEQTVKTEDLSELFDVFDLKTRQGASTSLKNFGGGMAGHGDDLRAAARNAPGLLSNTAVVSEALAADSGVPLENMLRAADGLSKRVATRSRELEALMDQLGRTADAFGVDRAEQVRQSLAEAPSTLDAARTALRDLNPPLADTGVAMRTLRPGAASLGAGVPDLRGLLREAVAPLKKVPPVNHDAEPALTSLTKLVDDARPLIAQLVTTSVSAAPVASVLGRYAFEISDYYTQAADALSHGDRAGHWLRILLLPGAESIAGTPDLVNRDPYPEPGTVGQNRTENGEAR